MVAILGGDHEPLDLKAQPPAVILLAGLQGAGKTTSAAKIAKRIIEKQRKRVMLVSVDVHRPAAILQLKTLASEVGALHCDSDPGEAPVAIVERALDEARRSHADVLVVDTAGRLHIDSGMMQEAAAVHAAAQPHETLFVVDSMAGQDAVNSATAFDQSLPLTGVVLTKADLGHDSASVGQRVKVNIGTSISSAVSEPCRPTNSTNPFWSMIGLAT